MKRPRRHDGMSSLPISSCITSKAARWRACSAAASAAPLPPAQAPAHRYGRALGREQLDALLASQAEAAGATLFQPWALQAIEGSAGRFRLRLRTAGAPGDACELEAGLI